MLRNYFKIAFRNILRYKGYSLINILGLAIGMTACLLIFTFVTFEKSYDRFQPNGERIYRLRYERTDQAGTAVRFASCCPPAGLRIRMNFPEVEQVARLFRYRASVSHETENYMEERMYFAEPDLFRIFSYSFVEGDPNTGISEPNTAFISRSCARKYFGDMNPMGQMIKVDQKTSYRITGIFEDTPKNSHLKVDILLSYANLLQLFGKDIEDAWGHSGWFTYLLLKPQTDLRLLNGKIARLVETEFGETLDYYHLTCELPIQPLHDIHLMSHFQQEYETNGDKDAVEFLSIIAILVVVIAWVNYINLSTARSLTRAREIGLRKVSGASRIQLMRQLFLETVILNLVAVVITLALILVLLPQFRQLTGIPKEYIIWGYRWFWMILLVLFLAGTVISGIYPAIVLTSFKPVAVLRGKFGNRAIGIHMRKALVGFQLIMAIGLLICTFAVYRQLAFMKEQALGFSIGDRLIIQAPRVRNAAFPATLQVFRETLMKDPAIRGFSVCTDVPGKQVWWDAGGIHRVGSDENKNYQIVGIDYHFTDLFNLEFVSGRNFSREFPSDSSAMILNETAVKWMGFENPETAIGQQVDYWGSLFTVVGVLKDYHQQSVKHAFEPHIYRLTPTGRDVRGLFALEVVSGDLKQTIAEIRQLYQEFFPGNPFDYFFLDDYFNRQYLSDERFGKVFGLFSFLAVFVTCLGILGLSSFMMNQRTMEISIRKVMGANVTTIALWLSKGFLKLILLSFVLVLPVVLLLIEAWLDGFAERITLTPGMFLIPLLMTIVITCLTICIHVVKAAMVNPVRNLRVE